MYSDSGLSLLLSAGSDRERRPCRATAASAQAPVTIFPRSLSTRCRSQPGAIMRHISRANPALMQPLEPRVLFSGEPLDLVNLNGTLLFTVNDGVHGRELWKSDGTAAGTAMVKD